MMEIHDLEVSSEFIVMAATLLEIKSKCFCRNRRRKKAGQMKVTPEELVQKLLEYKKYKEASLELKDKLGIYSRFL